MGSELEAMGHRRLLLSSSILSASILAITGCGGAPTTTTVPIPSQLPHPASSLYLAQNSPNPYSTPSQILIFPTGVSGNPSPSNVIILPSSITVGPIAVDSSGNVYAVTPTDVREYAANATGIATPIRLIPANSTTTLNVIIGLSVDSSGNLYVLNDGVGIDIFSSNANGSVAPSRIIPIGSATTLSIPMYITVDGLGNLYVSNVNSSGQGSVVVFGPTANGNVAPDHILSQFAFGLSTDAFNNLYLFKFNAGSEIDGFAPGASDDAYPFRILSLGQDALTGFTSGPAGELYVGTNGSLLNNARSATPTFLEFSTSAVGTATPTTSFVPVAYTGAGVSGMAAY
jgi:hypothetical protein